MSNRCLWTTGRCLHCAQACPINKLLQRQTIGSNYPQRGRLLHVGALSSDASKRLVRFDCVPSLLYCTGHLLPHQALPCPEGQQRHQFTTAMPVRQHASPLLKISKTPWAHIHACYHSHAHLSSSIALVRVLTASTRHAFSNLRVVTACISSRLSVSMYEASVPGDGATSHQHSVLHILMLFITCPRAHWLQMQRYIVEFKAGTSVGHNDQPNPYRLQAWHRGPGSPGALYQ